MERSWEEAIGSGVHAGTDRKAAAFGHIQLQGVVRLDAGVWRYCAAASLETGLPNIPEPEIQERHLRRTKLCTLETRS